MTGDVRRLHRQPELAGALFQAASQFNALEMVGPNVTPEAGITGYQNDRTQGPACAISCAAATAFRNYLVDVRSVKGPVRSLGQTEDEQLDGLEDLGQALRNQNGELWDMQNGYSESDAPRLREVARRMALWPPGEPRDALRGLVRFGTHFDTEVTERPAGEALVAQAFCSAHAVGYSRCRELALWEPFARLVLEAAYEGTLWAAVVYAAMRRRRGDPVGAQVVMLTKLGGGVFGNEARWIKAAIRDAVRTAAAAGAALDVRIVHYGSLEPGYEELEGIGGAAAPAAGAAEV